MPVILIVEDQDQMRETMRKFLHPMLPSWEFLEAADGESALRACNAHRPSLVLMDIMLPDTDGISLTGHIKIEIPTTKVVFVSYLGDQATRDRALAAGGSAYVHKDRLYNDLYPAIRHAICDGAPPGKGGRHP